jgi:hypothetical protein
MRLLLAGLALLMLAFVAHLLAWRVCVPKRPILAILQIFAATLLVVAAICVALETSSMSTGITPLDVFRILTFYVSFSLVYACVYSAIETQSPSLAIVSYIASCGTVGCSESDIANHILDEDNLSRRVTSMELGKMIVIIDGKCVLTRQGRWWAALFECASNIFRLPLGG